MSRVFGTLHAVWEETANATSQAKEEASLVASLFASFETDLSFDCLLAIRTSDHLTVIRPCLWVSYLFLLLEHCNNGNVSS